MALTASGKIDVNEGQYTQRFGRWRGPLQWVAIFAVVGVIYLWIRRPGDTLNLMSLTYLLPGLGIAAAVMGWNAWRLRRELKARNMQDGVTLTYAVTPDGKCVCDNVGEISRVTG